MGGVIPAALQRSEGILRLRFGRRQERTFVAEAYQQGSAKVLFPRQHGATCDAVVINLGGGMTDGDRFELSAVLEGGAHVVLTTQAAEKIYRSRQAPAAISADIRLDTSCVAEWLPQETILFDRSNLRRRLNFTLAAGARLLAVESLVFGRSAYGETVRSAALDDRLRIVQDGRLVWFDAWRLEGDLAALLDRPAIGAGSRAMASIYWIGPNPEGLRDRIRPGLEGLPVRAACSIVREVLAFRLLAVSGQELRQAVARTLTALRAEIYGQELPLPRVWQC